MSKGRRRETVLKIEKKNTKVTRIFLSYNSQWWESI